MTRLICIVGPTASGKTDLALELAEAVGGEIICADSRTVYRGMDIGTAKPTPADQRRVPHHLLDVTAPGERLSAAVFKELAEAAIADIARRERVPFLVGGTGLYIDAILFDYQFPPEADAVRRAQFEAMPEADLVRLLAVTDPEAYADTDLRNRRRVIRALETAGQQRRRSDRVRADTLVLGLSLNKEVAQLRSRLRAQKMLDNGLLSEIRTLAARYGWDGEAMSGVAYRAFKDVVLGRKTVEQAKDDVVRGDVLLMKKQMTWFRRNPAIHWLENPAQARSLVNDFLDG